MSKFDSPCAALCIKTRNSLHETGSLQFTEWMSKGELGNAFEVLPNGLDSVPHGIQLLLDHKVSGKKLVYRVKDTPADAHASAPLGEPAQ